MSWGRYRLLDEDEQRELYRAIFERNPDQGFASPDGTFAWSPVQCLDVLRSLEPTGVAVLGGEFFRLEPVGLVPAYDGWQCEREPGETDADYADRSRSVATYEVGKEAHADLLVVLELSHQGDEGTTSTV